jgi:hypothetical protein
MLDGADHIDWASLDRAYHRQDDDVAAVLRAVASDDEEKADAAFETLTGWIAHQGTIYETTTACVPFLIELAAIARFHRADLVWEAGYVADADRTGGPEHDRIRAALARHATGIAGLVSDDDPRVRAGAVYALTQCGDACPSDVLWRRWAVEESPDVRAALLLGLGDHDAADAGDVLTSALLTGSPPERLAAAVAISRSGVRWPAGGAEAVADLVMDGVELDPGWFGSERGLDVVASRTPDDAFVADVVTGVFGSEPRERKPDVGRFAPPIGIESATYMIGARCERSRRAPRLLVPLLGPLLRSRDPEQRHSAVWCLSDIGTTAIDHAEALTEIASRPATGSSWKVTDDLFAIRILIQLGHPGWVAALCGLWSAGRRVDLGMTPWRTYRPVQPETVAEIGRCLVTTDSASVVAGLAEAACSLGRSGEDLEASLRTARPLAGSAVSEALVCIGRATDADLQEAADLRMPYRHVDLKAAIEICRRTGDITELAGAVARRADSPDFVLRSVLPLAHHFAGRTDVLRPFLRPDGARLTSGHVLAAHVMLRAGDRDPAVSIIRAGLSAPVVSGAAAELAVELADPALEADLRHALSDRDAGIHAATALVGLGADPDEFAGTLRRWLHNAWTVNPDVVRHHCRALAGPATAELITELADTDERVVTGGEIRSIIWEDELLQRTLHDLRSDHRMPSAYS